MMKSRKPVTVPVVVFNQFFWTICAVALIVTSPLTAIASTLIGTESRVTTAAADQFDPAISSNIVIYTDFSGVDADVWYTDLYTAKAYPVTTAPGDQQLTGVSGNLIVYTNWNTMDVYVYDITIGTPQNLTNAGLSNSLDPSIGGDLIAWTDDRDGNAEIYAISLNSGEIRRISNDPLVDESPGVGDGLIAWERCDGYACDILVYEWATGETRQLTVTPYASERFPDVYGRKVAYQREQGTPIDKNIVVFDLDTGTERVLSLPGDQENPHISGDFVAYNDSASGVPHIGLWQLSTDEYFQVTQNANGQYLNDIDGNRIVYSDNRAGTLDIWMFTFSVENENRPPDLSSIGNKMVMEGQNLTFTISAQDPDNDALTYQASNLPTGATFDGATRTFSWTPDYGQAASYPNVLFTVTDNGSPILSASEEITITVGNTNRPPILNPIGPKPATEGQTIQFTLDAYDPDNDAVTLSAGNIPNGATFDKVTGTFIWTPTYAQSGDYAVRFTVTDNAPESLSDTEEVIISVGNINRQPVLGAIGDQIIAEGQTFSFVISAVDPDGDALTYSAQNLPAGASFNPITQTFTWTPGFDKAGIYENIEFSVQDNGNPVEIDVELINITVGNTNRPPVFMPVGTQTIPTNQLLQFAIQANDPDGDVISYSMGILPVGASFDPVSRLFLWTPNDTQSGNYTVVFYATDGNLTGQIAVSVTVGNALTPGELVNQIINSISGLNLPKQVENSYLANIKKVLKFIQDGKITPAINQLQAFIKKVQTDVDHGIIGSAAGNNLISLATQLISTINS